MRQVVPRGNVRKILVLVGEVQDSVGKAKGIAYDDRNLERITHLIEALDLAFDKCLEIRNLYAPID